MTRYEDLLQHVPKVDPYQATGAIYPFRDAPYELVLATGRADRDMEVFVNEVFSKPVRTDTDGNATFELQAGLPPDDYEIRVTDPSDGRGWRTFISIRHYATILKALASVFEELDAEIDEIDAARSIETVGLSYIEDVYGRRVRQPMPSGYLIDDYRWMLMALRPAYRHFGGHRYGLETAVSSLTSVTPFKVPDHWRPRWLLGSDISRNGAFTQRSRLAEAMYLSAGLDLPNLNVESLDAVLASFSTTAVTSGFTQPAEAQKITVTFAASGQRATIIGLDESGLEVTEEIPDPAISGVATTYTSQALFSSITSAQITEGAVTAAMIGLADTRFVKITRIGDYNLPDLAVDLTYSGLDGDGNAELQWGDGEVVACPTGETSTLKDVARRACAVGTVRESGVVSLEPVAGSALTYFDKIFFDLDEKGVIRVDFNAASISLANIAIAINAALAADDRYGAHPTWGADYDGSSEDLCKVLTDANGDDFLTLTSPYTGETSTVEFSGGPADGAHLIFGLPRSTTYATSNISTTSIACNDTSRFPDVSTSDTTTRRQFRVRLCGSVNAPAAYTLTATDMTAVVDVTGYTFTSADVGGFLRLGSDAEANNNGMHRIIGVSSGDAVIVHEDPTDETGFVSSTGSCTVWRTQIRTVTNNNTNTNTLTVDSTPLTFRSGCKVELVSAAPYSVRGTEGLGEIDVYVDTDYEPGATSDPVTPIGSMLPDGWLLEGTNAAAIPANNHPTSLLTTPGLLVPSPIVITGDDEVTLTSDMTVEVLPYKGLPLTATFWLETHNVTATTFHIEVSFDEGSNWFELANEAFSTPQAIDDGDTVAAGSQWVLSQNPDSISGTFYVPYDCASCWIRLRQSETASFFSVEKMTLTSETGTGLSVGTNTVPRSQKRQKFGEILYVWAAEVLTDEEREYLGLPVSGDDEPSASIPEVRGHIDYITNAHGYWERVDLSEIDDSTDPIDRTNIRGVYDSVEWTEVEDAPGLTNLEVYVGTPPRMSHVRPTRISLVEVEELTMVDGGDGPGTARATLEFSSNHEGTFPQQPNTDSAGDPKDLQARLVEVRTTDTRITNPNGTVTVIPAGELVPLPDDTDANGDLAWEFTAADQIRINSPYYDEDSTYYLTYEVLMRAETEAFSLPTSRADYVWIIDFTAFKRHNIEEVERARTQQVVFNLDGRALLKERANISEAATLTKNTGIVSETVSRAFWDFVDQGTVRIDKSVLDLNAIYSIEYTARIPRVESDVEFTVEWRHASTEGGITSAEWEVVENNQVVSSVLDTDPTLNEVPEWHQLRVTVRGVEDVRDFRIYGMGLKGIQMFGGTPYAPGVVTDDDV